MSSRSKTGPDARPVLVAPSILSADFARLGDEVAAVEEAGADWLHVDVMDGHFVPNITIGLPVVSSLRRVTSLPIDAHLMIADAERYAAPFVRAGADRVSVHVEACPHLHRTVQQIKAEGAKAGAVLNPATPVEWVEPILGDLDYVLLMTVNPGFGGQRFISSALSKVSRVRELVTRQELDIDIQVDGGVSPETIGRVRAAGANVFVAGSAIFKSDDYGQTIQRLREEAQRAEEEETGA